MVIQPFVRLIAPLWLFLVTRRLGEELYVAIRRRAAPRARILSPNAHSRGRAPRVVSPRPRSVPRLTAGIVRHTTEEEQAHVLSAFGLAYYLVTFLTSPLVEAKQLALNLGRTRERAAVVQRFTLLVAGIAQLICIMLVLVPALNQGVLVLHSLAGPEHEQAAARFQGAVLLLSPTIPLNGFRILITGYLLQQRKPVPIAISAATEFVLMLLTVVLLMGTPIDAIHLVILATYMGTLGSLAILVVARARQCRLPSESEAEADPSAASVLQPPKLDLRYCFTFFYPLALTMAVQGLSRPLTNLFVAAGNHGEASVAGLTAVFPISNLAYGWLNDARSLRPAFADMPDVDMHIRKFMIACCAISVTVMLILFASPLANVVLIDVIGLAEPIADICRLPLIIFCLFPIPVAIRTVTHGKAIASRLTNGLSASGPARVGVLLLTLFLLKDTSLTGATIGTVALLLAFCAESAATVVGLHIARRNATRQLYVELDRLDDGDLVEEVQVSLTAPSSGSEFDVTARRQTTDAEDEPARLGDARRHPLPLATLRPVSDEDLDEDFGLESDNEFLT